MAKRKKVTLTEIQKNRNAQILAEIQAEQAWLLEDTRRLQQEWKRESRLQRAKAREAQK